MRSVLLLSALLATAAAVAASRDDFGYEWPLTLSQQAGAQRIDLTPEVYAHLTDRGLRDLDAFNAAGEPLPLGTIPEPAAPPVAPPPAERVALPWFTLPEQPIGPEGGDLHLSIVRDPNGTLRRIDADVSASDAAPPPPRDVLVDASALTRAGTAIELSWAQAERAEVNARFRVLAADDLDHWRPLVGEASIVDLNQNGFVLQRRRIELPIGRPRYLLLQRLDAGAPLAIDGVRAVLVAEAAQVRSRPVTATARFVAEDAKLHAYDFAAPGPLPSIEVAVELASPNSVATIQVLSRDSDDGYWQLRAAFTGFRVSGPGGEVVSEPQAVGYSRDRQWRIVADPPLDRAPVLKLAYRPDTFVVLPRGAAPYVLAAGSAKARRADYPMQELLGALQRATREPAALPLAQLGQMRTVQGEAAMTPAAPPAPVRKWVLWGTLALGAAAVVFMVLNLIRNPPAPP